MARRHPGIDHAGVFVTGLTLSERCYREVVAPLLGDLPHSAARLGPGSEVLGFDTPRLTDHDWGARLQLFVERPVATAVLSSLPATFLGQPTRGPIGSASWRWRTRSSAGVASQRPSRRWRRCCGGPSGLAPSGTTSNCRRCTPCWWPPPGQRDEEVRARMLAIVFDGLAPGRQEEPG